MHATGTPASKDQQSRIEKLSLHVVAVSKLVDKVRELNS